MQNPVRVPIDREYYAQRLARYREMRDTLKLSPMARKMVLDEIRYMNTLLNNMPQATLSNEIMTLIAKLPQENQKAQLEEINRFNWVIMKEQSPSELLIMLEHIKLQTEILRLHTQVMEEQLTIIMG